jgi:hypothetical protein
MRQRIPQSTTSTEDYQMCVSVAKARLTGTTVFLGETDHRDLGLVNVLGYQNTVVNLASGPNAMILHFPTSELMTQENILDTSECRNILKDMVEAIQPSQSRAKSLSFDAVRLTRPVVFNHDIYSVVLANDPRDVLSVLDQVPSNKRPPLNSELFDFYADRFRSSRPWPVAVCCFDNKEAKKAAPLLWYYQPFYKDLFFVPALDAHDGGLPTEEAVEVDHHVIFGSPRLQYGSPVSYRDQVPSRVREFLPDRVIGKHFSGRQPNGDFVGSKQKIIGTGIDATYRRYPYARAN